MDSALQVGMDCVVVENNKGLQNTESVPNDDMQKFSYFYEWNT